MYLSRNLDDPRRRALVMLLAAGAFAPLPCVRALAAALGEKPGKLPPGRSIFRLTGPVSVNGAPAKLDTQIPPTATIETGKGAELVFVNGDTAHIVRESSRLELGQQAQGNVVSNLMRLLIGKVLVVFPPGKPQQLDTSTAEIGIRGTGVYAESDPEQTYFCTCYGVTEINAKNDKQSKKKVKSHHHDEPVYILAKAGEGKSIRAAPFKNHTDQELMLIEALVGREPPFVFPSEDYGGGVKKDYFR